MSVAHTTSTAEPELSTPANMDQREQTSTLDPVARFRAHTRWIAAAAAFAAAILSWWAFRPLENHALPPLEVAGGSGSGQPPIRPPPAPLNASAFAVELWTPEPEVPAPPIPIPTRPFKLQLVGILRGEADGDVLRAVVYDPDANTLHIVGNGDSLAPYSVSSITESTVTFVDGVRMRRLALGGEEELP